MIEKAAYSAHQASPIVPIHGAFSRISNSGYVALATEQNGVNERLGFVEVLQQENGRSNETE